MEILLVLGVLLAALALWQRHIDRTQKAETIARLQESRDRGAHRAVAQHPQIKPFLCIGCGSCLMACPEDDVIGLVNGIAHVINGSRCVGHAKCQDACPVGAIEVGLGDLKSRPDLPVLTDELETTIPGVFIAGELGGMALIRHAVEQGARVIDVIESRLRRAGPRPAGDAVDVAIIGAGPAGLSATLRAHERRLSYRTISQDDVGGTITKYPRRKLTLVQRVEIPLHGELKENEYTKEHLIELWQGLIRSHGVRIETGASLASIERRGPLLHVVTTSGALLARHVVLALGRRGTPRKLGVPGEELPKVLYQLVDAATYTNQHLLVVGGGDSAIEIATALANQAGNKVTLSYRNDGFTRLKARNESRIRDYIASGRVKVLFSSVVEKIDAGSVTLSLKGGPAADRISVKNDFVFVAAGGEPPYPLLKKIGVGFGGESSPDGKSKTVA